ncbi:hypothetical protein Cgig2_023193 [Carnegiea gigantea]|uniref:Palmitoyltransferase n=1 Tax=Carnegiea gigantea TaxID=171969 RepID=A0A9Q1JXL8_9CARY|nr:hypothetical protein Cgig2_023193 [Carnegiea gigantea]
MRKHGWQLPYHPLQVVAVAVFLALGFAFYVFFAPFVGKQLYQYIIMGVYTPLIVSVFGLYIWCGAADPADLGVFKSKKYCKKTSGEGHHAKAKDSKLGRESVLSKQNVNTGAKGDNALDGDLKNANADPLDSDVEHGVRDKSTNCSSYIWAILYFPCTFLCNCISPSEESSERHTGEDGMFYCSLCEVEGLCTILAMLATLPLAQLFFFHILLIKKGISTYDYIVALREQEQQEVGGAQSPQMSQVSSFTGLSSASSFNTFRRGAWCTPPRLFLEDQVTSEYLTALHDFVVEFDVVPPDTGSVSSYGKRTAMEEPIKKKNPAVKISPWTLARLNAEEVSKAAAEARKKSKILQPVVRRPGQLNLERDNSFGSSGRRMVPRLDHSRRRTSKRIRLPAEMPLEPLVNASGKAVAKASSSSLAPLQLEARSAFRTSLAMSGSAKMLGSSPESSLADSPDAHPFRLSSSGAEESRRLTGLSVTGGTAMAEIPLSRSTSDGYEASGGEDSDQVPSRPVERPVNWSNVLFGSNPDGEVRSLKASSSSATFSQGNLRKF